MYIGNKNDCIKDVDINRGGISDCHVNESGCHILATRIWKEIKAAMDALPTFPAFDLQGDLGDRIHTQPEVRLRVGAFDVGVLVFLTAAIFLASVHRKCLRHTEDVDIVFTKKNSSLLILEREQWIRMLCDSSNFHKQKL